MGKEGKELARWVKWEEKVKGRKVRKGARKEESKVWKKSVRLRVG